MRRASAILLLWAALGIEPLTAQNQDPATLLNQEVILDQGVEVAEPETPYKRWTIVPLYTITAFNDGRAAWQEEYIEILYQPWRNFIIGTSIDILQRPPSGTDILYSGLASWYPVKYLELHTKLSFCPDPQFSPDQIYNGGLEWLVAPRLLLLLDYTQYNFSSVAPIGPGSIEQVKPGFSWWFTDDIFLTFRYAHGWAYNDDNYNYYSGNLNFWNMPGGGRLSVGLAYGTDPDLDFGTGDTSLSNAWIGSVFYQQPITEDFALIAGLQYVYRLRENNSGQLYQQWSPTIGAIWKF
jgi:YaiO family outer membrane protein